MNSRGIAFRFAALLSALAAFGPNADPPKPRRPARIRTSGRVDVKVTLATDGNVLSAEVLRSSGSPQLDEATLRAARASRYTPELFRCVNAGGAYIFRAQFQ
jgi:TonB family protein